MPPEDLNLKKGGVGGKSSININTGRNGKKLRALYLDCGFKKTQRERETSPSVQKYDLPAKDNALSAKDKQGPRRHRGEETRDSDANRCATG